MIVIDSFTSKNRDRWVLEDIEAILAGVEDKSFDPHTKVAAEEIFYVAAATPCVVAADVTVVGAKHWIAFTRTLNHIYQPQVGIVFSVCESIGAPEIHIPFVVAVPFRTRRHVRDLLHFFSGINICQSMAGVIAVARGDWRLSFRALITEQPGENDPYICDRRIIGSAEQWRNIQPSLRCGFPRNRRPDHEAVERIAACLFCGDILVFHLHTDFETLIGQQNWSHDSLGESPFAAAVAGILFFEEPVHGPLNALAEILGEEQTKLVSIGNFGRAPFFFLLLSFFSSWSRWNFFVSNRADTEFVFSEECRIKWNLVPICKSPSCFETHCLRAATAIESFELRFCGH